MPRYLLGSQCLVDIAKGIDLAPQRWLRDAGDRGIDGSDIYISAVTPMILGANFEAAPKSPTNQRLRENVEKLVQRYVAANLVAPITKDIADEWGKILPLDLTHRQSSGVEKAYTFHEKLVFATAIAGIDGRAFTLVERRQKAHNDLAVMGLVIEDPYQV
jgi:hypothetical protein